MEPTKDLALLPSESDWARIKEISLSAVKSGFLPQAIKTPEQAAIIALKGIRTRLKTDGRFFAHPRRQWKARLLGGTPPRWDSAPVSEGGHQI